MLPGVRSLRGLRRGLADAAGHSRPRGLPRLARGGALCPAAAAAPVSSWRVPALSCLDMAAGAGRRAAGARGAAGLLRRPRVLHARPALRLRHRPLSDSHKPNPHPLLSSPASRGSKTLTRFSAVADDDGAPLEQHVGRCLDRGQRAEAEGLLDLEASYARRAAPGAPFVVEASTFPWLVGEELPDFGPSTRPAFGVGCFGALFLTRGVIRQPARSSRAA